MRYLSHIWLFFVLGLLGIFLGLYERGYFNDTYDFTALYAAGNERSFSRVSIYLANYPIVDTFQGLPESRIFISVNILLAKLLNSHPALVFPGQLLFNVLIGSFAFAELMRRYRVTSKKNVLVIFVLFLLIMSYSIVLLRDIWLIWLLLLLDRFLEHRRYLLSILVLIIIADFRVFTFGLSGVYFVLVYYKRINPIVLLLIALAFGGLIVEFRSVISDLFKTLEMYSQKTQGQLDSAGLTKLLSVILGNSIALFVAFILQPSPSLLLRVHSFYTLLYGASTLMLISWFRQFFQNRRRFIATSVVLVLIGLTSGELRHKLPFMLLTYIQIDKI